MFLTLDLFMFKKNFTHWFYCAIIHLKINLYSQEEERKKDRK